MKLEVDIRKKLGRFQLDVSFDCDNETVALLGASGSGKSMTMKCIAGIETPDEGKIVLNGRVLFDSKKKINLIPQKRNVGYMFQDYALFPNMTVRQNINIVKKEGKADSAFFERFYLKGLEEHYPSQLSGGQKQRAAMARMLAAEPEMIILDEPFSALDAHLRWSLEQEVKGKLISLNKPALFVSHDRDEVYRISDKTGAIKDGKMNGVTPTKNFFKSPLNRTEAILSGCKNIAEAVRTDETRVYVPQWDVTLETGRKVEFDNGFVGIRAHRFKQITDTPVYPNIFQISDIKPTEDPFEWNISFLTTNGKKWIQWKVSKDIWEYNGENMPDLLWVKPEDVLLLEKD